MDATHLGESRQRIMDHLKRSGSDTIPSLAGALGLNVETVRAHLRSLGSDGLVRRAGQHRQGPGRPENLYGITEAGEALFPNREGEVLLDLVRYLYSADKKALLDRFFEDRAEVDRAAALARVQHLEGDERLDEVVRIFCEDGFMAERRTDREGRPVLRLCNCPLRRLVSVTEAPCRVEGDHIRALLGKSLVRVTHIPSGDGACSYGGRGAG